MRGRVQGAQAGMGLALQLEIGGSQMKVKASFFLLIHLRKSQIWHLQTQNCLDLFLWLISKSWIFEKISEGLKTKANQTDFSESLTVIAKNYPFRPAIFSLEMENDYMMKMLWKGEIILSNNIIKQSACVTLHHIYLLCFPQYTKALWRI